MFDLLNIILTPNGSMSLNPVGYFLHNGREMSLKIDANAIRWNPKFSQTPESRCNARCQPGYHKAQKGGIHSCCYYCVPCPENEITNTTDMEKCYKCPEDHWSNDRRDICIPRPIEFLCYTDILGFSLAVIALFFCFGTIIIYGIFLKHRNTPIIKANNQILSFLLLLSLMLSFLCSLLFIGCPTKMSCLLRQTVFSITFSVAVSSVLAKTVTVVLAFTVTKPTRTHDQWLWRHFSVTLVVICTLEEVLICATWLAISPPFPYYDTHVEIGKMILQCNEGSTTALYIAIGYMGCLAVLSFIVAYLARTLPDTFNEAQYITFSMLVFCSVWISFIPAYLSTKGKYMVAVEVFSILASSAGLLGCIFIPKCYIILLRPELNVKATVAQRRVFKL